MILDRIQKENDIKKVEPKDYKKLAGEIRHFLVEKISKSGGHLSSNLGAVELTMALHVFLDFPEDKLVWDVGHQSYTHKILTGRKEQFSTLRCYEGLSGFPKRKESDCDVCDTGHSSTSISIALGMAVARDLEGKTNKIVAVLGDGALSGGMAYEALNNAARLKSNLIVVLNDNNMSISENVGGMSTYLGKIRTNRKYRGFKYDVEQALRRVPKIGDAIAEQIRISKESLKRLVIPGMLFEDMGLTYIGPIDGHNMEQLLTAFESASKLNEAVIIHVVTKKGKGYPKAEKNPSKFHGIEPFFVKTGESRNQSKDESYTSVYSHKLIEMAEANDKIVAITAAMPSGTGLLSFQDVYPNRFFDVGIAEQHAVTFAAGLALNGYKPFVTIYSTFLQRAYDQILHDVCINNLPVVFAVDRAGIVGKDGETHQGIFDISFLTSIPNMTMMAPKNKLEFEDMLDFCQNYNAPVAIRYPRGEAFDGLSEFREEIILGKAEWIYKESEIALLSLGSMVKTADTVRKILKEQGHKVSLINARFICPLDKEIITEIAESHSVLVCLEENIKSGGFGEHVSQFVLEELSEKISILTISIPDIFVEHGSVEQLHLKLGLDAESVVERILKRI
ncbi:1-deoxy-D-xylulose-5-phosphate synthase [Anaeromicropila populeti]|uniref:1-deoxy-D-xylulose-5-phosphate synthase n=1 Tax=Anaeromicropila populeti TaxID=37658 RepID=A0A1I6IL95_9FIRM|nr:1-deoxy-D-xylulose-5-phosphate synthase [Anaeromicropila populeti]SFR67473.1 1-deoxy-D-xylulose-5-phosphate synthase [Anaeromicropila populeti]